MSKQNTIVAKRKSDGTIIQRCPMAQPKRCAPWRIEAVIVAQSCLSQGAPSKLSRRVRGLRARRTEQLQAEALLLGLSYQFGLKTLLR